MKTYFKSEDTEVRLCLPSGHVAIVTNEETELLPIFHKEAYRAGLIGRREDQEEEKVFKPIYAPGSDPLTRVDELVAVLMAEVNAGNSALLTKDGVPKVSELAEKAGFAITSDERDAAWVIAKAALDAADAEAAKAEVARAAKAAKKA